MSGKTIGVKHSVATQALIAFKQPGFVCRIFRLGSRRIQQGLVRDCSKVHRKYPVPPLLTAKGSLSSLYAQLCGYRSKKSAFSIEDRLVIK